jgi:hypothetical protein
MGNISSVSELKNAIEFLKGEQAVKGRAVREHFYVVYDSLKPVNLLAGSLKDIARSPLLVENIVGLSMGLLTGTMTKSLFIGASGSKIKNILGTVMQYGITNYVANHTGLLKAVGESLIKNFAGSRATKIEMP